LVFGFHFYRPWSCRRWPNGPMRMDSPSPPGFGWIPSIRWISKGRSLTCTGEYYSRLKST